MKGKNVTRSLLHNLYGLVLQACHLTGVFRIDYQVSCTESQIVLIWEWRVNTRSHLADWFFSSQTSQSWIFPVNHKIRLVLLSFLSRNKPRTTLILYIKYASFFFQNKHLLKILQTQQWSFLIESMNHLLNWFI